MSVSAVFNALMIQAGDHVLFSLPDRLPLFGGPFTLEGLVYGALNGLVLTGLYAAFLLVNQALPVRDMVRLAPRAYHSVAIVVIHRRDVCADDAAPVSADSRGAGRARASRAGRARMAAAVDSPVDGRAWSGRCSWRRR